MVCLILAFTQLSQYNPSISNPYDSINCRHLCTRMRMHPFVSCCSERGMPDSCVCFSAEIQVSASWGLSARRWNTLDSRCMNIQAFVCVCVCVCVRVHACACVCVHVCVSDCCEHGVYTGQGDKKWQLWVQIYMHIQPSEQVNSTLESSTTTGTSPG